MPVLDWSSSARSRFVCTVCRDGRDKRRIVSCEGYDVYRCGACACLLCHPVPEAGEVPRAADELLLRDHLEMNAALETQCREVEALIHRSAGRLLDVSCGFGFSVDYAQRVCGWEAVGFEPSAWGAAGRGQLGVDIRRQSLALNSGSSALFDVVYCSGAIAREQDPWRFLHALVSYLKPGGTLFLSTPDAERIRPAYPPAATLAMLSPGRHVALLCADALAGMLRVLGFESVHIDSAGSHLAVTATRGAAAAPAGEPADGFIRRYREYLAAVQRSARPDSALHRGCVYRLYRSYVDALDWAAAAAVFDESLIAEHPKLDDIRSFAAFAQRFPLCVAPMTYCRALQTLNDQADYARAARLFRAAQALCRKKMEVEPDRSVVEEELLWRAVLHEGIACKYAGRRREVVAIARAILAEESAAPEPIRERAARELA